MDKRIGILLFERVNELDFVGPYEVLTGSDYLNRVPLFPEYPEAWPDHLEVCLITKEPGVLTCEKGMRVDVRMSIRDCPALDVLLVPGGSGVDAVAADPAQLAWIRRIAQGCEWVTSVCNGVFVLAAAGLTQGRRVTTHWAALDMLRETRATGPVLGDIQFVRDGKLVSSAGVSAGIDMSLWLLGQLTSPTRARLVQRTMQYNPAPPYTAEL